LYKYSIRSMSGSAALPSAEMCSQILAATSLVIVAPMPPGSRAVPTMSLGPSATERVFAYAWAMSNTDPASSRLENTRRSIAMAPPRSAVTLQREEVLDLLSIVLRLAADGRRAPG
jgi:hypothetical protein